MSGNIIQKYLTYLSKERGYSDHTIDSYKKDLKHFEKDLKANVTFSGEVNNGICINCSQSN